MKFIFTTAISLFLVFNIFSQGIITVMHYNLLNYGIHPSYTGCSDANNSQTAKNGYLKTIVDYVLPDVLTVNEIYAEDYAQNSILTNVLNVNGRSGYQKAASTGSSIANMIFYNSNKLIFVEQKTINIFSRDADVYKFYYNSSDVHSETDRVYITFVVAHLAAGSSSQDYTDRASQTEGIMNYLNLNNPGNFMIMGDFNLYNSSEVAYQNMIYYSNENVRVYDPINKPGDWGTSSFKFYHTQSTHADDNGCAASGGMDDRFDFILISGDIKNGTNKVQYATGTYKAVGQDGNHYNKSINDGANSAVSTDVANALYGMSDHLPVALNLEISQTPAGVSPLNESAALDVTFVNPVPNESVLNIFSKRPENAKIEIVSVLGQTVFTDKIMISEGKSSYTLNTSDFSKGIYLMNITTDNAKTVKRFLKN